MSSGAAIAVFTLGSIACGFSQSLEGLVTARALQGVGGAMMVPVGRLVLLRAIPKSQMVNALAYLTIPALIGPLIGPPSRRFHHDLFPLAMDIPHQCPGRNCRPDSGDQH